MRLLKLSIVASLSALAWHGCGTPPPAPRATFKADKLRAMDSAIESAISERRMPGAVLWLEHNGAIYSKAYGQRSLEPQIEPMTADTIFDAASLTKVIATAPAIMLLIERGLI